MRLEVLDAACAQFHLAGVRLRRAISARTISARAATTHRTIAELVHALLRTLEPKFADAREARSAPPVAGAA